MKKELLLRLDNKNLNKVVKIQGTKFDRNKKMSDKDIRLIQSMKNQGKSITEIAKKFNVSRNCIMYHTNEEYKKKMNSLDSIYGDRHGARDFAKENKERGQYKRNLIKQGLIKKVA